MDPEVKNAIFAELDSIVIDSNEKVNINQISQEYDLSFRECSDLFQEWCKAQEKVELKQEYLVRGLDKNGVARICIVPKNKLDAVEKKFERFISSLFAMEKASETKSLDQQEFSEGKRISLPLECKARTIDTILIEDDEENTPKPSTSKTVPTKKEPVTPKKQSVTPKKNVENNKSVASMFANAKPKEATKKEAVTPKKEPVTPKKSVASMFANAKPKLSSPQDKEPHISPKSEAKTPSKGKNVKSTPTKRKANSSNANSAKTKTSIASFFGNAPAKKALIKAEAVTPAKQKDKSEEKMEVEEIVATQNSEEIPETPPVREEEENTRKRSITNESEDEVVNSSQIKSNPPKRFKSQEKKKMRKKGNRIMQMSDSSDEEEKENNVKESEENLETEGKQEESEIESTPQKEPFAMKRKKTVKQQKYRTYEDENGYLVAEKYVEEVSCSDDEVEVVPEPKKEDKEVKKVEKKPVQKAATKQGSIMSFFGKK